MGASKKKKLTHLGSGGIPRMVDVSGKQITLRTAKAFGSMHIGTEAAAMVEEVSSPKGSVVSVATVAAIVGAKRTAELIPLCHNLPLDKVDVEFDVDRNEGAISCTATVSTRSRTGVEMEALTAVHIGLLTVYDMCKAVTQDMKVTCIKLLEKKGSSSELA